MLEDFLHLVERPNLASFHLFVTVGFLADLEDVLVLHCKVDIKRRVTHGILEGAYRSSFSSWCAK